MTINAETSASNRPQGRMTGGRALAEMLRLSGAGPMFGMGGFQLLPFYDALSQLGMRHFLINDERCGAFAADAYARVTVSASMDCRIDELVNLLAAISAQPEIISTDEIRCGAANPKSKSMPVRLTISGLVPRRLVPEKKGMPTL